MKEKLYCVDGLPFDIGPKNHIRKFDLPEFSEFGLCFDHKYSLVMQQGNKKVERFLMKAYKLGSMLSTPLGEGSFGDLWARDVISAIKESLKENGLSVKKCNFLEIGCGNGYLLYLLKKMGAKRCVGIEPGPQGRTGAKKYKIDILPAFLNRDLLDKDFDFVYSHGVLEHVRNLKSFMKDLKGYIKENGIFFAAVPNCENKFKLGDVSFLAHEHWNYFTPGSLGYLLSMAGIENLNYKAAGFGGMIYAWGNVTNAKVSLRRPDFKKERMNAFLYVKKIGRNLRFLQNRINEAENKCRTIGIYGLSVNLAALLRWKHKPRFFDADKAKQGQYFSGLSQPVERVENLIKSPVNELWISPVDHDRAIRHFLNNKLKINLVKTRVISLKALYEGRTMR